MGNRDNIPADTFEQLSFSLMTVPDILPMGKYFIFLNTSHIEFVLETLNIYQMVLFQLLLVINISLVLEAVWILQGMKKSNEHSSGKKGVCRKIQGRGYYRLSLGDTLLIPPQMYFRMEHGYVEKVNMFTMIQLRLTYY